MTGRRPGGCLGRLFGGSCGGPPVVPEGAFPPQCGYADGQNDEGGKLCRHHGLAGPGQGKAWVEEPDAGRA